MPKQDDWTEKEVKLIVREYFEMFQLELIGKPYNKTAYRKRLLNTLNNRTESSIEFKNHNISAALSNMGLPYIKGYKPRFNYQRQLEKEISDYVAENRQSLEKLFFLFSENATTIASVINYESALAEPPELTQLRDPEPKFRPIRINYLEREQNNRTLGEEGEKFVLGFERWRLTALGKENLADKIEWVAKSQGDGLGFDILSKNINGTDRFIEVKTTKLPKETPIYLTKTEVNFATQKFKEFFLYRVFSFDSNPQLFIKNGCYTDFCRLQPESFRGYF
jgi:hypothetical protein